MTEEYTLYCDFDIDKHEKTFINYLEVVIDLDGIVHYAVPSHQEYLIKIACELRSVTRQELSDMCPQEYYFDFLTWLCMITGYVVVYNVGYTAHSINDKQQKTLDILIERGLMENNRF